MDLTPEQLPDTIAVEHEGRSIPLREHSFVKEAKDLPSLLKTAFDAHRELGSRVRLPGKDTKPEDLAAFKAKLVEAGVIPAPLKDHTEYGITRPEKMPEGLDWNQEWADDLAKTLHKHGVPKGAVPDLLALHEKIMTSFVKSLDYDSEGAMAALRAEFPQDYEKRRASVGRIIDGIFRKPEEMAFYEELGLGNHPLFLGPLLRLAPFVEQESSWLPEPAMSGGEMTGDEVRSEVSKIMYDKTHPMHEKYLRRDPEVEKHIDGLYKKAYGNGKVTIS